MKRKYLFLSLTGLTVAAFLWAPWITKARAEARTVQAFETAWQGVVDGCGFQCEGCGVKGSRRVIAGHKVEIEYACGLIPYDAPEFHMTEEAYVSFLGTVHNISRP